MDYLRRELHEAKAELEQKETEINNVRAQLKRATVKLSKLKHQGQVVSQVTDEKIVEKVEQMRYRIRDFSFQHFEDELSEERLQDALQTMQNPNRLRLPSHRLYDYLISPIRRTLVIRSYIWLVLMENVAGLYYWSGSRTSKALRTMDALLAPYDDLSASNKEIQKWNDWRVTTTRLVWDARNGKTGAMDVSRTFLTQLVDGIYSTLRSLTKSPEQILRQHISDIIRHFLEIDRILSMQVADYYWDEGSRDKADLFEESTMNLDQNEELQGKPQSIALLLAPALRKFGTSGGSDYVQSVQLLKMQVSCQLPRAQTSTNYSHSFISRVFGSRTASRTSTVLPPNDTASVNGFSVITLDGDAEQQIADELNAADTFLEQGFFTRAYPRFQVALNFLSKSPTPMPSSFHCHAHLGMAECRISASDDKTAENALEYLKSAHKHALKAIDLTDDVSRPAAQMALLVMQIKETQLEAGPDGMSPRQVATLYGQLNEQIEVLQELIDREDGIAQRRSYKGLLRRGKEWQTRLTLLGSE